MMLDRPPSCPFFFFNDTATTEIYTLSLHDALPIYFQARTPVRPASKRCQWPWRALRSSVKPRASLAERSEEHTSELQSQSNLVCRLLLEKKNCLNWLPCPRISSTSSVA